MNLRIVQQVVCPTVCALLCIISLIANAAQSALPQTMYAVPLRLISGLEPELVDANTLKIFRGSTADINGKSIVTYDRDFIINLKRVGLDGMDSLLPIAGQDYFVYAVRRPDDGNSGFVVSSGPTYSEVAVPKGYVLVRKLPWGFKYFKEGVRPFHISYWPKPFTRYTFSATSPEWAVLEEGRSRKLAAVDLSRFIPDNARMAYVLCVLRSSGKATAYLSSGGGQELQIGQAGNDIAAVIAIHQRITSRRELFYRIGGEGYLSIYVLGYSQTEPS